MVAALPPQPVRDGAVALPNVPHVVTLGGARVVLWDTAKRRADRLANEHVQALVSLLVVGTDRQREDVAAILANAACDKHNRRAVAAAGAIPLLVSAVASKTDSKLRPTFIGKVARALANLAWENDENQRQVEASGGVDALVDLLARGDDVELQDEAATALSHLVDHTEIATRVDAGATGETLNALSHKGSPSQAAQATWLLAKVACHTAKPAEIATLVDIPALVEMLTGGPSGSATSSQSVRAAAVLRRLSLDVAHKSEIVVAGGLAPLIGLLKYGAEKQKVDAAWTLGHLAWNAFTVAQIANAGAIAPLVELLQSPNVREREGAVWALRQLSCTSDNRMRIGSTAQGIPTIVESVRSAGSACEREHAIATLKNLACNSENQAAIVAAGAIPHLVAVLTKGTVGQINQALAALRNLVRQHPKSIPHVSAAGGIRALAVVLSRGSDLQRVHAAASLANLASDAETQSEIVAEGALPPLLTLTESKITAVLEQVTLLLRNLIWGNEAIQGRVGASGVVTRIIAMLQSESDTLRKNAAAVLRNLAWQNPANQEYIREAGGVAALVKLLTMGSTGQREQAAGALANLAWNNPDIQEQIARCNALNPLADLTSRGNEKLQKQAALAIRHFVFSDNKKIQTAAPGVIPSFVRLLSGGPSASHQQQATWALANLACNVDNKVEIVSAGGIRPFISVLTNGSSSQKQYAASAIANLACNLEHKTKILAAKAVPPLVELVARGSDGQKKQAAWALRNLAWNCPEGQSMIAAAGGIAGLVLLIERGSDSQKEHAAAAIANLACLETNHSEIAGTGGVEAIIQLMKRGTDGQKLQSVWAMANLAMSPSNRAIIIDAGGTVALQHLASTGNPDHQRGASAALARINDPGSHNFVTSESHAVYRSPNDGSEDSEQHFREMFRAPSMRASGLTDSRLSTQLPKEIKIGKPLYRSIASVPEIVTRSPLIPPERSNNRSPATRTTKLPTQPVRRANPDNRQNVLRHLPSVQEVGSLSRDPFLHENIERSLHDRDELGPPPDHSLPLRRVKSENPPVRVAYRMPPSPVEQTRPIRPMLQRPSTLGDLLDPHGGYSPPKEQAAMRRHAARVKGDVAAMSPPVAPLSRPSEHEDVASNGQAVIRAPSAAVEFRDGRPVRRSLDDASQGSRHHLNGDRRSDSSADVFRAPPAAPPRPDYQKHRNFGDEGSKFFGNISPLEHSGHEEVYEFDETQDLALFPAPHETESKYPIISL